MWHLSKDTQCILGNCNGHELMEETSETAAPELELNSEEKQRQSDSMDGPSHSQNQEASNAMEEIIDNDDGDVNTDDNATTEEWGQA